MSWVQRGYIWHWEDENSIDDALIIAKRKYREYRNRRNSVSVKIDAVRIPILGKRTRAKVALCGTPSGHTKHRRKSEPVCDACKEAWKNYQRERYAIKKAIYLDAQEQ